MKKKGFQINSNLIIMALIFLSGFSNAAIDPYDSVVVRTILDRIGWVSIGVENVVSSSVISIGNSEPARVTALNLTLRSGLKPVTSLPDEISQLPELTSLSLRGNMLTKLPDTLSSLRKLSRLDLSFNCFSSLPEPIKTLPIQVLTFDNNPLRELPDWISELSTLQSSSFANDSLISLTPAISKLKALTTLNLDSNQLRSLPLELTALKTLKISIKGNRLCSVDSALADWLDKSQLGGDWRASQKCDVSISSTITDALTGTVLYITSETKTDADCLPAKLTALDVSALGQLNIQKIVKAVEVRFNDCFADAGIFFIISFSWKGLEVSGSDLAIYYDDKTTCQYLGGLVDSINRTISVKASREGTYILIIKPTTTKKKQYYTKAGTATIPDIKMHGRTIQACFTLNNPSIVSIILFTIDGRIISKESITADAGITKVSFGIIPEKASGNTIAHLYSKEFRITRVLKNY